jgi:hypothetical protein
VSDNSRSQASRLVIAVPHRVHARQVFLGAVMTHTGAIEDLDARRTTLANTPSTLDHRVLLERSADPRREAIVREWAEQWRLAAPWVESWGVYALTRWEVGAACCDPQCPYHCTAICWDDDVRAFEVALFGGEFALMPNLAADPLRVSRLLGFDRLPAVKAPNLLILRPSPLIETQDEWLARATDAYIATKHALTAQGIAWPRELDRHSAWLVRVRVLDEKATAIADAEHLDVSTVHRAIRSLAQLIDLPFRC